MSINTIENNPFHSEIMDFQKLYVKKRRGRTELVDYNKITARIKRLCWGLDMEYIDLASIVMKVIQGLYSGVTTWELDNLASETCAVMSTDHPDYGTLAARIFVSNLHKETDKDFSTVVEKLYRHIHPVTKDWMPLVSEEFYNNVMANKDAIDAAIIYDRDFSFSYFGLKTLEKAYLLKINNKVVERPQHLLMRVAVALHGQNLERIVETYEAMSRKYFIHATPTLFNAGTMRAGLSSCFLLAATREDDSIENIYKLLGECAVISKYSGGIGLSIHDIRAKDSLIMSTNGKSEGIIPLLGVFNKSAQYVTQSNKRPGSIAVFLEPWHAEIFEFLKLKENHGKDEFRAKNLFYGLWIPDLFMEKAKNDEEWCLFCPNEAPGLPDVYGKEFEDLYYKYESLGLYRKKVRARKLLQDIIQSQIRTGVPYMCYKDAANRKNNQKHIGTIRSSNLCVAPETMILTSTGYHPIASLKDQKVRVWNGKQFSETVIKQTSEWSELMKIKFSNGIELECTPYHKFYLQDGYNKNKIIIKEAKNLIPGKDKLIKADFPVIQETNACEEFKYPYTAGFFSGDGTYATFNEEQKQCSYKKYEQTDYCKRHQQYDSQIISKTVKMDNVKCQAVVNYRIPKIYLYGEKKNLLPYIECRYSVEEDDRITCLPHFDIPEKYSVPINSDMETKMRFFEGLCDADGTAPVSEIDTTSLQLSSNKPEFLRKVQLMLQTMGVDPKLAVMTQERDILMPDGKGGKKVYNTKTTYRLLLTNPQVISLVQLGFSPKRLNILPGESKKETKRYVKVIGVEYTGRFDKTFCFNEPLEHKGIFNGVITSQCVEIMQYSSHNETSVCNLSSLCLPTYVKIRKNKPPEFDFTTLYKMTKIVTRNLDRVIDVTHYPVEKARYSNMRHRPMGIGVSGLADAFSLMRLPFDSVGARELNKKIFETISYAAYEASCDLAKELGKYETYEGSEFSKGKFQWDLWEEESGEKIQHSGLWDWNKLKEKMKKHGMRNSLLTAAMPTASTSQIMGVTEAFEPLGSNVYKRNTLAGEFPVINKHLLKDLCALKIWNKEMKNKILENEGSIQNIEEIPKEIRQLYKITWDISQKVVIDLSVDRAPYIDQSQSLNVFLSDPTFASMTSLHFYAFSKGLKTGMYYLRQNPPTQAIQVTVKKNVANKLNAVGKQQYKQIGLQETKDPLTQTEENVLKPTIDENNDDENNDDEYNDDNEQDMPAVMACSRDQSGNCLSCSA